VVALNICNYCAILDLNDQLHAQEGERVCLTTPPLSEPRSARVHKLSHSMVQQGFIGMEVGEALELLTILTTAGSTSSPARKVKCYSFYDKYSSQFSRKVSRSPLCSTTPNNHKRINHFPEPTTEAVSAPASRRRQSYRSVAGGDRSQGSCRDFRRLRCRWHHLNCHFAQVPAFMHALAAWLETPKQENGPIWPRF